MGVPISQMWTVATYMLKQRLAGRKRYPLLLMLEPLFRCNLSCAGCGKIQYPSEILKKHLTPEECFKAAEECGAPMVSIPGGEPLLHPRMAEIVQGLVKRKKYVYLCTNGLLLKEKLPQFHPSRYLTINVHLDGQREEHDRSVCRKGGYDRAVEGIREAIRRGFRVTTNTTLFNGSDPKSVRAFFDEMMDLGVEGMTLSPGYSYSKAPDQDHFLGRAATRALFRGILSNRKKRWRFNQSALFLEVPDGPARLRLYAMGHARIQRVRLAEALLSAPGRVCRDFRRAYATDRMAQVWRRIGKSRLRQLHGAQRV